LVVLGASAPSVAADDAIRVLIVTGNDHPAHDWRATAPVVREILEADSRFEVRTVDDPEFLASPILQDFDVVLLHFMNWKQPDPGTEAQSNLHKFVDGGKGLFVLHFACGAFGDWPDYANLAGRVWDKKTGHDPRGPFRVNLVNTDHPVTRGMESFGTDDELYICLTGKRPVDLLANARSKKTGKDHEMAFAFDYGKGRVFHTPLGHDVKAIRMPGTAELIRRGCAWAAGAERRGYDPRVAVGLYAWVQNRSQKGTSLWDDLDAVLGEVRKAGLHAVEGFLNFYSTEERAERTERLLRKHGVVLAGLYTGGVFHEEKAAHETIENIMTQVRRAKHYPQMYIDVNPSPLPKAKQKTDEELDVQARMLDLLGARLQMMGLPLVIHQHKPEILHEAREHRHNVSATDARYVGFCIDTDWVFRGGQDPVTLLEEAGRRTWALHLRSSKDGVWTETLGPGDVDYPAVAKYLRQIEFTGWLSLELANEKDTKVTRSIVDNHRLGREYVESVFLKPASKAESSE